MVEPQPSKLVMRVRFPSPAPAKKAQVRADFYCLATEQGNTTSRARATGDPKGSRSACCAQWAYAIGCGPQPVFLDFKVVAGLQVHPEPLGSTEVASQAQCGVRANPPLAMNNLVNPPGRDTQFPGQLILAHVERPQE